MDPIRFALDNPVKISVGVILVILFGLIALSVIPVQLMPNVDQPVITVTTSWEGANPQEIESEVIREQEDQLKELTGLKKMTSFSRQGQGQIRLEFPVGTDMTRALLDTSEKLRQVPSYPLNVDEPIVEATDSNSQDYIAWIILSTTDADFDVRQLQKWAEDHIKTRLERVPGVSEANVLGGAEPELQVRVDPNRLAQHGITADQLATALRTQNINRSAGDIDEGKLTSRVRTVGEFEDPDQVRQVVISPPDEPVVRVRDVADVVLDYKEPFAIVRSKGQRALAINAQREVGSNVLRIMQQFKLAIAELNGNVLPNKARELGLNGDLTLVQVYDQTVYIDQAVGLVRDNLYIGGVLTVLCLLAFLRSFKFTLVISLAIPISIVGTFVAMAALGRNLNVIALAGLAFAIGEVVDDAIVALENIDRHRRLLREAPDRAAYTGAKEVWGAILASTLTTIVVFLPVLFIQEEAGQLFRDLSLAICASIAFSLLVSVFVIPPACAWLMREKKPPLPRGEGRGEGNPPLPSRERAGVRVGLSEANKRRWSKIRHAFDDLFGLATFSDLLINRFAGLVGWLMNTWTWRLGIILGLTLFSIIGSYLLMPPTTYLPRGNRNLVFGFLIPPPGYSLDTQENIGKRIESVIRPYWEAYGNPAAAAQLPPVPLFNMLTGSVTMVPCPPVTNFFFVGLRDGRMFTGAISADDMRVDPVGGLLNLAINQQPGIFGFADKFPLIQTGASNTGIELQVTGPDIEKVNLAAGALLGQLFAAFGPNAAQPDPGNFNLPAPETRVQIDLVRAKDLGLTNEQLALTVQILGDGAIIDDYNYEGDSIDLTLIHHDPPLDSTYIRDMPVATPSGRIVPLGSFADVIRTTAPQQINHVERQRSVTINVNLPPAIPLDTAVLRIQTQMIQPLRDAGVIDPSVQTIMAGTAAKLSEVKTAMLGKWTGFNLDSIASLLFSSAFLAILVCFLLLAGLFESWSYPTVIMFTVPLATVGGFLGLRIVHEWTSASPLLEDQQLDVLTMLGFIILIGIVVKNSILIVHQALNFMRGTGESGSASGKEAGPASAGPAQNPSPFQREGRGEGDSKPSPSGRGLGEGGQEHGATKLEPKLAIRESVRTRIRPIFMTTAVNVFGTLPLVLFPGPGSELYRGLGAVTIAGLMLSTVFTLLLTPLLLSLVFDLRKALGVTKI